MKVNRYFGGKLHLHLHDGGISQAKNQHEKKIVVATLKMEATCSSGTSVYFQWTTRRYIQEVITLQVKPSVTLTFLKVTKPALHVECSTSKFLIKNFGERGLSFVKTEILVFSPMECQIAYWQTNGRTNIRLGSFAYSISEARREMTPRDLAGSCVLTCGQFRLKVLATSLIIIAYLCFG
jgi:hypothetical protein